jgi:hypothetical protein
VIRILLCFFVLCGSAPATISSEPMNSAPEYLVKAAFIYNFAKFVHWPDDSFNGPRDRIELCVYSKDPFGDALQRLRDRTAQGRSFHVRRCDSLDELKKCHIVFIGAASRRDRVEAIRFLRGRAALTVGDRSGFADRGGMIELYEVKERIRFRINLQAARHAGLKISSELLKLAEVVK